MGIVHPTGDGKIWSEQTAALIWSRTRKVRADSSGRRECERRPPLVCFEADAQSVWREGSRIEIPLRRVTPEVLQVDRLARLFNTFSDGLEIEARDVPKTSKRRRPSKSAERPPSSKNQRRETLRGDREHLKA
jgi:hypothetical protein